MKEKISQIINKYHELHLLNGTVLVKLGQDILYHDGVGYANVEWNIKHDKNSVINIGSITKQFTALLLLQLAERKEVELDKTISDYLTYYPKEIGEKITLYQLLTQCSGLSNYTDQEGFMEHEMPIKHDPKDFIIKFCSNLHFEPGEKFEYSNTNYYLIGIILEEVTKKSFATLLKESIIEPLNLKNTYYDDYFTVLNKKASAYEYIDDQYISAKYWERSNAYAAGAMVSTVEDLATWSDALLNNQLLGKEYTNLMFKPNLGNYACGHVVAHVDQNNIEACLKEAFNYQCDELDLKSDELMIFHQGGIHGIHTILFRLVKADILIAILNNTGGTYIEQITYDIIKAIQEE